MMLFSKNLGDVVCVLGLVAVLGTANIATASEKPNVLVIMVDDLGYADLSSYGSTDLRTPNVDTLVSEGMRFNEFYSNSCVCSPTRAALLTGRFPDLVGMHGVTRKYANDSWGCLTPDSIMLPELFRKQGYLTSLIGKWHLGLQKHNLPNQRGFDEFHGFILGMMDDYWEHSRQGMHQMRRNETPIYPKGHATDLISQWSIDRMKKDVAAGKPFFQFLAYNAPHFPVQPPAEWLKRVSEREKGLSKVRAYMVAFVEHLDHNIGLVLNTLDELGIRDTTIVVFTSDNGGLVKVGSNNGSLRGGKTQVYEGGIKVPACIRWPKHITAGQTTDFYALTMDILPTIAELCGVPIEHEIEGRSFADLVITGKQAPFNRINYHTWMQKYKTKECIRDGSWKLLNDRWQTLGKRNGVRFELYDLKDDPFEKNNLAKSMPEKAVELSKKLETHLELANKVNWKRPSD